MALSNIKIRCFFHLSEMKIILLANHAAILPAIDYFYTQGWLQAVVSTDRLPTPNLSIADICRSRNINFIQVTRLELQTTLQELFAESKPDLAIMLGFSYLIPESIFTIPQLGFYNIHFSLLPAYRGPDPIFWQLKNGETTGGITIHQVDAGFDSGDIVLQQKIPFIPGENWGICNSRYAQTAFQMILQLTGNLRAGEKPGKISNGDASTYGNPVADDMAILWEIQAATEIEQLVNACNPVAGGAICFFRQQMVRILEVSRVDHVGHAETPGGTIIHADGSGLFVQCADQRVLRIDILKLNEGFLTGFKLAAMGIKQGDRFENILLQNLKIIQST